MQVMEPPLDALLGLALPRLARLAPEDAERERAAGATLVDIRPGVEVLAEGRIPGALHVERTKLEWRAAVGSPWRDERIDPGRRLILICSEGFGSILAAATMQELGFPDATDVIGGFDAWRAAGLPVEPAAP